MAEPEQTPVAQPQENIQVIKGLEVVRNRPHMFLGDMATVAPANVVVAALKACAELYASCLANEAADAQLSNRNATMFITARANAFGFLLEWDTGGRAPSRDNLDRYCQTLAGPKGIYDAQPAALLTGLSERLLITLQTAEDDVFLAYRDDAPDTARHAPDFPPSPRNHVYLKFELRDIEGLGPVSRDMVLGAFAGYTQQIPGLKLGGLNFRTA